VTDRIHSTDLAVILNLLFSALLHERFQCCMHSIQNEITTEVIVDVIALITADTPTLNVRCLRALFDF
jgi:hypothetical protein